MSTTPEEVNRLTTAGMQAPWTPESGRSPTPEELLAYYSDEPEAITEDYEAPAGDQLVPEPAVEEPWTPESGRTPTAEELGAFYIEPEPEITPEPIPLTPEEQLRQTPGLISPEDRAALEPIIPEEELVPELVAPEPVTPVEPEVEPWDPESGEDPTPEQLRVWSGISAEDAPIRATMVNPVQLEPALLDGSPGRTRSALGNFTQSAGKLLSSVPKAIQLWFAPDTDLLGWMDEMDRLDAEPEDGKTEKAPSTPISELPIGEQIKHAAGVYDDAAQTKERHIRSGKFNYGGHTSLLTSGIFDLYVESKENTGDVLVENREKARALYLDEMRKTVDRPLYKAGESFDKVVRDSFPSNPEYQDEWLTSKIPSGLGSVLGYMTVFAITRGPASVVGAVPATVGIGVTTQQAFAFEDALTSGAEIDEAFDAAFSGYTVLSGASEAVPISRFFGRADAASGGAIKKALIRMFKQGSEEALQEGFQDIMGNLTAQKLYDPERQLWGVDTTGEAAAVGFTTGAIVEFLASMFIPGRRRGTAARSEPDPTRKTLQDQIDEARAAVVAEGGDALDEAEAASRVMADMSPEMRVQQEATKNKLLAAREARAERNKAEAPLAGLVQAESDIARLPFEQRAEVIAQGVAEEIAAAKRLSFERAEEEAEVQKAEEVKESEYQQELQKGEAQEELGKQQEAAEAVQADVAPTTIGEAIEPEARKGLERMQAALAQEKEAAPEPEVAEEPGREYPIAPRGEWYADADYEARGGTLTEVTPDEFLAQAAPLEVDEVARDNIDDLKRHMEEGRTLDPVTLYGAAEEGTRASDGRHRAIAAKELGMKTIPMLDLRGPAAPAAEITAEPAPAAEITTQQDFFEEPALPGERPVAETNALIKAKADQAATSPTNALPEPTEAQIESGNYKKGHLTAQDTGIPGIEITIENPAGSTRSGTDAAGNTWSQKMRDHYGYIKRTESAEGAEEQLDVFVGENLDSDLVFIVDQVNQNTGEFDEHKVMMGYGSQMDAVRAYKRNYQRKWKVGPVTVMTREQFAGWLERGDQTQPVDRTLRGAASAAEVADIARAQGEVVRFSVEDVPSSGAGAAAQAGMEVVPKPETVSETEMAEDAAAALARVDTISDTYDFTTMTKSDRASLATHLIDSGYTTMEAAKVISDLQKGDALALDDINVQAWVEGKQPGVVRVKDAKAAVKPITDELTQLKPVIVTDPSDSRVPETLRRLMRDRRAMRAKGAYFNGKLYIFANNHETTEDVVRTLLHEGVAHQGLRALFKNDTELNAILDEVYASMTQAEIDTMRGRARAYANIDLTTQDGQRELAEEHIAHLAETDPQQTVIQRLVAAVRSMLRSVGMTLNYTNDDIVAILADTRRELRKTVPLNRINIVSQVQVAETGEVIEIEERADVAIRQLEKRMNIIETLRGCAA